MENYKTLMKEGKYINLCLWIGRFNIPNVSVLPRLIYRFSAIPKTISVCEYHQIGSQICKERQERPE